MNRLRPLIAGNWKMNGLRASMAEFEAMLAGQMAAVHMATMTFARPTEVHPLASSL